MESKKWYQQTWAIVVFLWLFFPIGLFLMWRYSTWRAIVRWSVTGVIAGLFVLLIVVSAVTSDGEKGTSTKKPTATSAPTATVRLSTTATARPSATTTTVPEATATNVPAAPTQPPLTNRADCGAIEGTAYLSEEERQWFLSNCSAPPPTQPPGGGPVTQPTVPPVQENCDRQSYPDVCIPPYPPDLNCGDIPYTDFRVFPPDPHGFDGNHDGIGCIS